MESINVNDNLIGILQRADKSAVLINLPDPSQLVLMVHVPKPKNLHWKIISLSAAAMILVAFALQYNSIVSQQQLAEINLSIQQLNKQADNTLLLVQQVIKSEKYNSSMNEMKNRITAASETMDELQAGIDKSAFALLYEADRLYNQLNMEDSAVETYKLLIKLFPDNKWSTVAKERLESIDKKNVSPHNTHNKET